MIGALIGGLIGALISIAIGILGERFDCALGCGGQVTLEAQARYADAFRREIFILRSCHDRNIVQFLGACLQARRTLSLNGCQPCRSTSLQHGPGLLRMAQAA